MDIPTVYFEEKVDAIRVGVNRVARGDLSPGQVRREMAAVRAYAEAVREEADKWYRVAWVEEYPDDGDVVLDSLVDQAHEARGHE